jgi:hypothetical protein
MTATTYGETPPHQWRTVSPQADTLDMGMTAIALCVANGGPTPLPHENENGGHVPLPGNADATVGVAEVVVISPLTKAEIQDGA